MKPSDVVAGFCMGALAVIVIIALLHICEVVLVKDRPAPMGYVLEEGER